MAIEKVIDIKVQGNADQAVGSLRSQLREAQADVAELSNKFGATSQAAIDAAKKAGELKDRIGDAKALTDAFNPDAKFKALTASLSGVAGGFAAVQGGMALFGAESENVQATLLKVQSAMALSQGIQALGEARDSFRQLGAVANDVFKSIKAAIGSTGIGLLVVALAAVVTYWDDIAEAIDGATDESKAYKAVQDQVTASIAKVEENLINVKIAIDQAKAGTISKEAALKKYNETLGTAFGKTDDLRVAEERMIANTENYVKAQTLRAAGNLMIAKAAEAAAKAASGEDMDLSFWQEVKATFLAGVSPAEGFVSAAKSATENLRENAKEQAKYTTLGTNLLNEAAELEVKIGAEKNNKIYEQNQKAATQNVETEKEKNARLVKEAQELASKLGQEAEARYDEILKIESDARKANADALLTDQELAIQKENEAYKIKYDNAVAASVSTEQLEIEHLNNLNNINLTAQEKKYAQDKEAADKEMALDVAIKDAKRAALDTGLNILMQFAGKNKSIALSILAIQKGLAIADVVVGAAKGIAAAQVALAAVPAVIGVVPNPMYAVQAAITAKSIALTKITAGTSIAAILAAGIGQAASITSGGGGGGGSTSPSGGGGGATAPQFNVVGSTGVNQLAGVMGAQQQTPVQTYVVANNVATAMALDRNIIQSATLGG